MTVPEFSRPERIDAIGERERSVEIAATPEECAALARRFDLPAIARLDARFRIRREAAAVVAVGDVAAEVVQACSITAEPLPATVAEQVTLRFVEPGASEEEVELSEDAMDTIEIEGGAIDLGEAAAETMALALDPFPRAGGADAALREAGVLGEEEAGPFGALAGLKAKLEGR